MIANRIDHTAKRRYSLRASLLWLLAACILPAISVAVNLAVVHYRLLHDQIHHDTTMLAREIAANLGQASADAADLAAIAALIDRRGLPEDWSVTVLDAAGKVVAASRESANRQSRRPLAEAIGPAPEGSLEVVADDGKRVIASFSRVASQPWTVVDGASKASLEERRTWLIVRVGIGIFAALTLGLWLAAGIARRVAASVSELNEAALALATGKPVILPEVQLAEAEAVGAAILEASRTMATVQQQAYHDPLTGLANRALFEDAFARQLASSERSGNPFAVLAIDLDEFKAVNDQQGHAAGDTVLRIAAERITGTVRASDVPARMGGDEFSVLLTDADRDDAVQTAERLVAALSQPYPDIKIAVSASVGIAVYQAEENRVDLLDAADRALYQAKGAGKKRAVLDAESDPAD